ncbi:MAG: hypothetical protein RLZZ387_3204 [Chloroflexota bacterium]|jgi:acetyltransferase
MAGDDLRPFAHGKTSVRVVTRRGRSVRVRHIVPADDDLLVELYRRMSEETRRLRFMVIHNELPEEIMWREAHRLSDINPLLAAALVGTWAEADGREHAVGVARLARDAEDPTTAEMAIVIRDDFQREGLGAIMLDLLIQIAMVSGVRSIRAVSLAENEGIHQLVQRTGLPVTSYTSHGETTQIISLV